MKHTASGKTRWMNNRVVAVESERGDVAKSSSSSPHLQHSHRRPGRPRQYKVRFSVTISRDVYEAIMACVPNASRFVEQQALKDERIAAYVAEAAQQQRQQQQQQVEQSEAAPQGGCCPSCGRELCACGECHNIRCDLAVMDCQILD